FYNNIIILAITLTIIIFFFFQAEDGIRDRNVTGVQTCALPISLAKFLAKKGEEVLVIEKSNQMYGGTCINIACLPSKRLIIEAGNGVDFVDAVNGKNKMTSMLRGKNYHMLADEKTVTVLDGTAKFT